MVQFEKRLIVIICVIVVTVGLYLRIPRHFDWIDEVKFFEIVRKYDGGIVSAVKETHAREVIPAVICHTLGLDDPSEIRWLFVLSGVAMILTAPLLFREKQTFIPLMLFIALNPLLVYWSAFARPYILAALFVMLAWRWPLFLIPAVLTNPIAIVGSNLLRRKWLPFYIVLAAATWIYYKQMPLSESGHFTKTFLLNARRIYVVPIVTIVLYICSISSVRLERLQLSAKRLVACTIRRLRHKQDGCKLLRSSRKVVQNNGIQQIHQMPQRVNGR